MPYENPDNPINNFQRFVHRGGTPVTNGILIANVATAVLAFFSQSVGAIFAAFLLLNPARVLITPWTLLTYPFVNFVGETNALFNLVICAFFFWISGGSLERSWGSAVYFRFFMVLSLVSGLSLTFGAWILAAVHMASTNVPVFGFFLPLVATIVAFCSINPDQQMVYFFIPLQAKYIAIIATAAAWISFGPALGLFACGGSLAAYLWVRNGRPWTGASSSRPRSRGDIIDLQAARKRKSNAVYLDGSLRRSPFDIAGKLRDMQERKRLERLLRNSGLSDPDEKRDERR